MGPQTEIANKTTERTLRNRAQVIAQRLQGMASRDDARSSKRPSVACRSEPRALLAERQRGSGR